MSQRPTTLKRPIDWEKEYNLIIWDCDGWRPGCSLGAKDFTEPISREEWESRMHDSTIGPRSWLESVHDSGIRVDVPPDPTPDDAPKPPKVGDEVYIPTSLYLSHGADDFEGGLCEVIEVKPGLSAGEDTTYIRVKERSFTQYNWKFLAEKQKEYKETYGDRRGHADPDYRPEFNRWD